MFLHFLHTPNMAIYLSNYGVKCGNLHILVFFTIASLTLSPMSGKQYILNKYCRIHRLNIGSSPEIIFLDCLALPFPWALHVGFYHRYTPLCVDFGLPTVFHRMLHLNIHTLSKWSYVPYFLSCTSLLHCFALSPRKPLLCKKQLFSEFFMTFHGGML